MTNPSRTPNPPAGTPAGARSGRNRGVGRVLIFVYGILAIAASGRSGYQLASRFHEAPLAYSLSALSAVVYIVATIALIAPGARWYRVAWVTISFELLGVLVIGTLSLADPAALGLSGADPFGEQSTVWSVYGAGYLFIPLVLPVLGMLWLRRNRRDASGAPVAPLPAAAFGAAEGGTVGTAEGATSPADGATGPAEGADDAPKATP